MRKLKIGRLLLVIVLIFLLSYGAVSLFNDLNKVIKAWVDNSYQHYLDSFEVIDSSHKITYVNNFGENKKRLFIDIRLPEKIVEEEITEEEPDMIYLGSFILTGYDDCPICQEEWVGTTALGVPPQVNHTIAVDPSVIPLGSYVYIEGLGTFRAEDVGGGVNGNHIDIFVGSHEETYASYCNGYADVYILK